MSSDITLPESNKIKVFRDNSIISTDLGDSVVMMSIEQGEYYALNDIGSDIWHLIEEPVSIGSVCNSLLDKYDVSEEECLQGVESFFNEMNRMGLINYG